MDLYIAGLGPKDIAERLEMERRSVSAIIHAPNFQHALAIRRNSIEENQDDKALRNDQEAAKMAKESERVLKEHAMEAVEKMVELMEDQSHGIQLRAAADILDRVGPSKQKGTNINQAAVVIIGEDAAKLINETLILDSLGEINAIERARPSVHTRSSNQCCDDGEQGDDRGNDEVAYPELSTRAEP